MFEERARGKRLAFRAAAGGDAGMVLRQILEGSLPEIENLKDASSFGRAITGLYKKPEIELQEMLNALKLCFQIVQSSNKHSFMSVIRRAVARLDELYFAISRKNTNE